MKKTTNNISSLRNGLNSLIKRTTENEIVITPLLSRFTKTFILEELNIISKFNYFYINKNFFNQIKEQLWEQFLQLLAVI